MYCYLGVESPNTAKRHVDQLMARMGYADLSVQTGKGAVARFFCKLFSMFNLLSKLKAGDVLVIQYPFKKFYVTQCRIARMKGAKTITLIHDLGTFRRRKLTAEQEIRRLSHTDVIIGHNPTMNAWLVEHGCKVPLVSLDIFDYLSEAEPSADVHRRGSEPVFVFAGGISWRKSAFIYQIDSVIGGCRFVLYGSGLEQGADASWTNSTYCGHIGSDDFIRSAATKADWGLVWDGDTVDGCTGVWGDYLRLNNPHKASFYLRAGLPVIVWRESAMAPFVCDNGLGIAVGSLSELPERLRAITDDEYAALKKNAMSMKDKLNDGYHFRRAVEAALKTL